MGYRNYFAIIEKEMVEVIAKKYYDTEVVEVSE